MAGGEGLFALCTLFVLSSCPVFNTAALVVQTAGGVGVYVSPCIETHVYDLFIPLF